MRADPTRNMNALTIADDNVLRQKVRRECARVLHIGP